MKKRYRNLLVSLIVLIIIYLLLRVSVIVQLVKLLVISFIIAYSLKPVQRRLTAWGISEKLSAAFLILSVVSVFVLTLVILIPAIIKESLTISTTLQELRVFADSMNDNVKFLSNNKAVERFINIIYEKTNIIILTFFEKNFDKLLGFGEHILSLAVVPVLVYYFISENEKISKKFLMVIPVKSRNIVRKICNDIDKVLSRYIVSQFILCLLIGGLTLLVLLFLKVEYPLLLSILNALFNIIPYFGPLFGAIPALLMALLHSPQAAIYTAVCLYAIQQIEGDIISPKITGDSVSIHPFIVILLLLMGGKIGGFVGMVLAVPIGVMVKIIYEDLDYYLF